MKVTAVILVRDTSAYPDYIPKGIQVTEQTRICIKSINRGDNSKVLKLELSFLNVTCCYDLFYITVKYHQNILNHIQVIERRLKCKWTNTQTTNRRQTHCYIPEFSPKTSCRGLTNEKQINKTHTNTPHTQTG